MSALPRTDELRARPHARGAVGPSPAARFLGVVVGPSSLEVGLTDVHATVLASARCPVGTADGPDPVVAGVLDVVRALRAEGTLDELHGAGVGLPGATRDGGAPGPGWERYPLGLVLARRLGCPVRLDDDTHLMALGEARVGSAHPAGDVLFVAVAEGVRCGIVLAGSVHRGARGAAGLVGHVRVDRLGDDGPPCTCGRTGCLDAYVGAPALERAARALAADGSPLLAERLGASGRLGPGDLAAAAAAGDRAAAGLVRETGRRLGEHLAGLVRFCDPAVVVLGGEVAAGLGGLLLEEVRAAVERCSPATGPRRVVLSRPAARAGVVGAALLARDAASVPA